LGIGGIFSGMRSIKYRILNSILVIIFITIFILDILLYIFVRDYYYNNSEKYLKNQISTAVAFYNKYFTTSTLEENVNDNVDMFWNQSNAQVQIYDTEGKLLMDSIGVTQDGKEYSDISEVLSGEGSGRWIGNVDYCTEKVMAVSEPIIVRGEFIGVIRYIVTLESVDQEVNSILTIFIILSIIVLIIGVILSIIVANSIIMPIKKVTNVAEKMASGDLNVRNVINGKDEVSKLAVTLNFMAGEILEREKLKDDFISSVSHELRTPLTAIKGWVITLEDENTDVNTLKTGLSIIEKESDRLGNMVEELLDFSRLQNGESSLKKEPIIISEFINYIETYMSQRAKRENKKLEFINNAGNQIINIDTNKMKQVLINLIDNAFKFTDDKGKIMLWVSMRNDKIEIIVKDDGCGITKTDLPKVKQKFYKGKNAKSQNGIGLSICDEIVKLHGGELIIESIENVGTQVCVIIPIDKEIS
jgi:signal transduction histidine kinase